MSAVRAVAPLRAVALPSRRRRRLAWSADPAVVGTAQGVCNVVGGLWPLLHVASFEAVFGPKVDRWLEHTVAGLLLANGLGQLASVRSGEIAAGRWYGCGTAATLLTIDLVYVPAGRIRWTYLLDAGVEVGWLLLWARARPA